MDPPLRTLLEPEARCPRGPASHRRRPPRQDRQARRPPRAQQEEEEEMNATISPAEPDYAVVSDTDTVRLQRVLPVPIEHAMKHLTNTRLRRPRLAGGRGLPPPPTSSAQLLSLPPHPQQEEEEEMNATISPA